MKNILVTMITLSMLVSVSSFACSAHKHKTKHITTATTATTKQSH